MSTKNTVSDLHLDSSERTLLHGEIIQNKVFLRKLYIDFYRRFQKVIKDLPSNGCYVELGSGGGFIKEVLPRVITSDVMPLPMIDQQFSALQMPFASESVDAFMMINVFHHIPNAELFLKEASRCLKKDGKIIMVEPANTPFARWIYQNFHHEDFDVKGEWFFESKGPLSSANGALPFIVFLRDRLEFTKKFPELRITKIAPDTPFRYLLSGGLSSNFSMPGFSFEFFSALERVLTPVNPLLGMFYTIEITKT